MTSTVRKMDFTRREVRIDTLKTGYWLGVRFKVKEKVEKDWYNSTTRRSEETKRLESDSTN